MELAFAVCRSWMAAESGCSRRGTRVSPGSHSSWHQPPSATAGCAKHEACSTFSPSQHSLPCSPGPQQCMWHISCTMAFAICPACLDSATCICCSRPRSRWATCAWLSSVPIASGTVRASHLWTSATPSIPATRCMRIRPLVACSSDALHACLQTHLPLSMLQLQLQSAALHGCGQMSASI